MDTLLVLSQHIPNLKPTYRDCRIGYNNLLNKVKFQIYENKIKSSDNKNKCLWSIHNEITGKRNRGVDCAIRGEAKEVANGLNDFFINIVPNLKTNLQSNPFDCKIEYNIKSMFLKPVTPSEILLLGKRLKNKNSSGVDDVPSSVIKLSIPVIGDILCYIINNSFKHGIFPDALKIAVVKPIYKRGDPGRQDNYRPISLLPGFSKVFEMAMCDRLVNFFTDSKLFSESQHGFLKNHSTQTAIYQYTQNIINFLEEGCLAMGICLDLSKAYDCLESRILLEKLNKYGVRGVSCGWLRSYLENRKQMVKIEKDGQLGISECRDILLGVPQGSILGPVLFLIFVIDLCEIIKKDDEYQSMTGFADDNNLLVGAGNFDMLSERSESVFEKTKEWYVKNGLILNTEKTNIILFKTKQSRKEINDRV